MALNTELPTRAECEANWTVRTAEGVLFLFADGTQILATEQPGTGWILMNDISVWMENPFWIRDYFDEPVGTTTFWEGDPDGY